MSLTDQARTGGRLPRARIHAGPLGNPFVHIPSSARIAIVLYFIGWRMLPEVARAVQCETSDIGTLLALTTVRLASDLLLVFPFLIYRFAGMPIGWVHPLVLPTLISIASSLVKSPTDLLAVVGAWITPPVEPKYLMLEGLSLEAVLAVELKRDAFLLLAQLSYLAGFFVYFRRRPNIAGRAVRPMSSLRFLMLVTFCFLVFVYFIQQNGGVVAHFSSLAYGRFRASENAGHLLVIINFLPFLMAFWYLNRPGNIRKWWFLALFAASLLSQYITSGSRSGMIVPIVVMLAAWMMLNHRTPTRAAIVLAALFLLGFGALGELRQSAQNNNGVADFSVLTNIDLRAAYEKSLGEITMRQQNSGAIAVMHAVPSQVGHLYGTTYVSALAFFIPRSIWPDKPRGAGAHVRAMIFGGQDSAEGYDGGGIPPGGMGEAYWNFGMPGIVVIFLLFGVFHRYVAQLFLRRPHDPHTALLLLLALIVVGSPTSIAIVDFLQCFALLLLSSWFLRVKRTGVVGAGAARLPDKPFEPLI